MRKLDLRLDLIQGASRRYHAAYVYANQQGCDGGRLYFDGCACVASEGAIVAQGSQFGLKDVEVVTAVLDIDRQRAAVLAHTRYDPITSQERRNNNLRTILAIPLMHYNCAP